MQLAPQQALVEVGETAQADCERAKQEQEGNDGWEASSKFSSAQLGALGHRMSGGIRRTERGERRPDSLILRFRTWLVETDELVD